MKKIFKCLISIILVLSLMLSTMTAISAASEIEEEYLSDMRLVYADTYEEAKLVLTDSKLEGYKILNNNLNANSGKKGVWLAYKTTTDVNDAITDVAVIQMGGGYRVGNYQEMIKNSREEYEAMGQTYLDAIDYFAEAYDAGNFLAEAAYRQLNFYAGLDKYKETKLGDLFIDGVLKKTDLATLFFEGNVKVTNNIRSLLAMGVSYNADGKHYLEKVADSAKKMNADPTVFTNKNYKELAAIIATSIPVFKNMLVELSAYEDELNYEDDVVTELEIKYAEYKSVADRMRNVSYLGGKTLYEFCLEYDSSTDHSNIYPLVDALNDGQKAMTNVLHYYDVVRYSMSDSPEELIDSKISELEKKYTASSVDVFLGVDRTIYTGSFALTSKAFRADAYTGSSSLADALFGRGALTATILELSAGALGVGLWSWAIVRSIKGTGSVEKAAYAAARCSDETVRLGREAAEALMENDVNYLNNLNEVRAYLFKMRPEGSLPAELADDAWNSMNFADKLETLMGQTEHIARSTTNLELLRDIGNQYHEEYSKAYDNVLKDACKVAARNAKIFTGVLYLAGAASLTYSAVSLYKQIHDHYHPKYDEIPMAMVDLVKTVDGDRYIKYDVVLDMNLKDGAYHAADLNAFEGERWNAVYYTKSSEAGKPLLADFEISNSDYNADEGYIPVHRFGEVVCYDLNKYNFSSKSDAIFMSIRQSENVKSDVSDVPDVVGAIIGEGFWMLAGCLGVVVGAGGTILTNSFLNKKKSKENGTDDAVA